MPWRRGLASAYLFVELRQRLLGAFLSGHGEGLRRWMAAFKGYGMDTGDGRGSGTECAWCGVRVRIIEEGLWDKKRQALTYRA
jgi:hypothetical protein